MFRNKDMSEYLFVTQGYHWIDLHRLRARI